MSALTRYERAMLCLFWWGVWCLVEWMLRTVQP